MPSEKLTHPRRLLSRTPGVGEIHYRFVADESPIGISVDMTDSGMRRLAEAAMKLMMASAEVDPILALAWEREDCEG